MSKKTGIFEVDTDGFRELQLSKFKWVIIRELLQNCLDEDTKTCDIKLSYKLGKAYITVTDDSPIGFRDISDAFVLFKATYKRNDVKKRGRFNMGTKQVLCLADFARIVTTTGGLEFDITAGTRTTLRRKREAGSEVYVVVPMTREEFKECCDYASDILVPQCIEVNVSYEETLKASPINESFQLEYKAPYKTFKAKLLTEKKEGDRMRTISLETEVHIHKPAEGKASYIYEMGIPICEIDCEYSIDVQQKVPMSNDRDNVDAKYLKTVYGEVLNQVIDEVQEEESSAGWVRSGFTSDRATTEARKAVITKRFGDKPLIANPFDKWSIDKAVTNNHNLIHRSELSTEEREIINENKLIQTSSERYNQQLAEATYPNPTIEQKRVAAFASMIAKKFLNLNITVSFYDSPRATVRADFNQETSELRFNVAKFTDSEWKQEQFSPARSLEIYLIVKQPMLDLIIHELGHSAGWHYEHSYHECITKLGSLLAITALRDPSFFNVNYEGMEEKGKPARA